MVNLRFLRPFSHTYIRNLSLVKLLIYVFYVRFRTHIFENEFGCLIHFGVGAKLVNLHYLRCFPKVHQFEFGEVVNLRYLRPFSHTHIRNLSLVKWLIYVFYVRFRTHIFEI